MEVNDILNYSKRLKVLFIDDNEEHLTSATKFFEEIFLLVDTASNGIEGLKKFKEKNYDLVITDFQMPEMNGLVLISEIKKLRPNQLIIVVSAFNNPKLIESFKEDIVDYIVKPIEFNKIMSSMQKIISILVNKNSPSLSQNEELPISIFSSQTMVNDLVSMYNSKLEIQTIFIEIKNYFLISNKSKFIKLFFNLIHNIIPFNASFYQFDDNKFSFIFNNPYKNQYIDFAQEIEIIFKHIYMELDSDIVELDIETLFFMDKIDEQIIRNIADVIKNKKELKLLHLTKPIDKNIEQLSNYKFVEIIKESIDKQNLSIVYKNISNSDGLDFSKSFVKIDINSILLNIKILEKLNIKFLNFNLNKIVIEKILNDFKNKNTIFTIPIYFLNFSTIDFIKTELQKHKINHERVVIEVLDNNFKMISYLKSLNLKIFLNTENFSINELFEFYAKLDYIYINKKIIDNKEFSLGFLNFLESINIKVITEKADLKEIKNIYFIN